MAYEPPAPLARDHDRRRNAPAANQQFRCDMCGGFWFIAATFARHRETEIPAFIADAKRKQADYEASRWRHRAMYPSATKFIPKVVG